MKYISFASVVFFSTTAVLSAQSIEFMGVSKDVRYVQRGADLVVLNPQPVSNFYGGAWGISFNVEGENLANITPPVITGPIVVNGGAGTPDSTYFNGGALVFNDDEEYWAFGFPGADDWGAPTKASLDAAYGNSSDYTLTVEGETFSLTLAPERYSNAPKFTLTGGEWIRGQYHIAADQELTITTNTFNIYGDTVESALWFDFEPLGEEVLNFASENPNGDSVSVTVPANSMRAGYRYELESGFFALTDTDSSTNYPEALVFAGYEVSTSMEIIATPIPPQISAPTSITPTAGGVTVSFETEENVSYLLEGSNDMEVWYELRQGIGGDGNPVEFYFDANELSRYYQVVRNIPYDWGD